MGEPNLRPVFGNDCLSKAAIVALSVIVANQVMAEPHLSVVPRTADEAARVAAVVAPTTDFSRPEAFEANPGGATTGTATGDRAFSQPAANLDPARGLDFELGRALFEKLWVAAPSSTKASDGLGPLYNARSCNTCHVNDGRGLPPEPGERSLGLLIRVSIPGGDPRPEIEDWIASQPDPVYGHQIQTFGAHGLPAEAQVSVSYTETPVTLADGAVVSLRQPSFSLDTLGYGPLTRGVMLSPRIAPPMIGLGLLEAIPAADILALADPDDSDGDGISGRAAILPARDTGQPVLGRFGWKAGSPSVAQQSAEALHSDIGIASPMMPEAWGECSALQTACRSAPQGTDDDGLELPADAMEVLTLYASSLAVPTRRTLEDPEVLHGKQVFYATGCPACHRPKFVTHRLQNDAPQSFQLIWPYSDLLLHDMGPGLADNRPEGRATGQEWRTPPLWGIGRTLDVSGRTRFLHDGRARTVLEAILWHGGEALPQRDAVIAMPTPDRDALIAFLESL